ncbi:hypothetical protein D5018_02355 [Parashewanella curva]|uniref:Uncharacterized protein n=1 Tax=Parashewanella curva TaxID=2338552 RepID=A0A3L8Q1J5_9GAMM|nr:hypothetical protein [Parashewanella curva]RLV61340.1 hypothetical protein D5018_02355 [Parashewanella curva]
MATLQTPPTRESQRSQSFTSHREKTNSQLNYVNLTPNSSELSLLQSHQDKPFKVEVKASTSQANWHASPKGEITVKKKTGPYMVTSCLDYTDTTSFEDLALQLQYNVCIPNNAVYACSESELRLVLEHFTSAEHQPYKGVFRYF